jgi:hypothetical protein
VARSRTRELRQVGESHDDVVAWYRARLAEPAVFPWAGTDWEPERLGPTWQTDRDGRWLLPEATLGWDVLGFAGCWLQLRRDVPWRYTLEQARIVLWWWSLDEAGQFVYRDGVIQRLKGWGKDPLLATFCATELVGPARLAGWDGDTPLACDVEDAWIPIAATALAQTKTTMRLFPSLFSPAALRDFGIQVGKELVYAYGDSRMIEAVTASPTVLEGIRSTFTVKNETQHWNASNSGHEMADVIERNATKGAEGSARTLAITNAFDPAMDSVAQRDREAWEQATSGQSLTTGILYDSLEAAPQAPLSADAAPKVLATARGDSVWLDIPRIVKSILDTRNPPSRSRRFWYNQVDATEDAWVVPQDFQQLGPPHRQPPVEPVGVGDHLAVFFDGSKSDDATVLVGSRIDDGHVVTLGLWQRPPKERGVGWTAPREAIDQTVALIFELYTVDAFYADPSHTRDDETQERYWDGLIDEWHRRYKDRLEVWASPGPGGHSVMWDMAAPARTALFTAAAERCQADIADKSLSHDGDRRMLVHVRNAKRYPNRYGVSLWKGHRESPRKVDLAVGMVGARMARRDVLNRSKPDKPPSKKPGRVW